MMSSLVGRQRLQQHFMTSHPDPMYMMRDGLERSQHGLISRSTQVRILLPQPSLTDRRRSSVVERLASNQSVAGSTPAVCSTTSKSSRVPGMVTEQIVNLSGESPLGVRVPPREPNLRADVAQR